MKRTNKRGTCVKCGTTDKTLPAHNMCYKCYDTTYPPHTRKKIGRKNSSQIETAIWPRAEMITIYHTSDDVEHGSEIAALKHQLDIDREKLRKAKCPKPSFICCTDASSD